MDAIAANLERINNEIADAVAKASRKAESLRLVAVSKRQAFDLVSSAMDAGQVLFGENYVQEGLEKLKAAREISDVEFHLIGGLQSNKAKQAVGEFAMIYGLDRESLAVEISKVAIKKDVVQDVLIQVNISGEDSKKGVSPKSVSSLASSVLSLPGIRLKGLMSIGSYFPPDAADSIRRSEFKQMAQLREELEQLLEIDLPELSMGMSSDFELAIEEGATLVRVGTAIFGERS